MTTDKLLTVREAASLLAVKPRTIYAWAAERRIPSRKVGRLLRFERAELLAACASVPVKEKLEPDYLRVVRQARSCNGGNLKGAAMAIRKRGSRWYVDISEKGKARVQHVIKNAQTRSEALKAEAVIRTQMFEKRYGLAEKPECRFDKFVEDSFLPSKLSRKSYKSIMYICNPLKEFFGNYQFPDIGTELVEKYKQMRIAEKIKKGGTRSPVRVNKELQVLSSIFTLAMEKELISIRPKTKPFQVSCERNRFLTPEEEERLMAALDDCQWIKNIVTMALHTGMRRGEIFSLKWFDVSFDRESELINVRNTKSGRDRVIPLNSTALAMLRSLPKSSEYVFPSPHTKERLVDIKVGFTRAVKAAKLLDFRFHDLRHTAATRMAARGADVFTLCSIFGWSDIRMSLRYTHAMSDAKRRAVEGIANGREKTAGRMPALTGALPGRRDKNVTNQKRQAGALAVND